MRGVLVEKMEKTPVSPREDRNENNELLPLFLLKQRPERLSAKLV